MAIVTLQVTKNADKVNLTYNVKVKTTNLTGTIIACEDFNLHGQDLSSKVVDCTATVGLDHEMANELMQTTEAIYAEKAEMEDTNPYIAITFECTSIQAIGGTGIFIKGIKSIEIDESYQVQQSLEEFLAIVDANRTITVTNKSEYEKQKRNQLTAEAVTDNGLMSMAKNFLNQPIGKPAAPKTSVIKRSK